MPTVRVTGGVNGVLIAAAVASASNVTGKPTAVSPATIIQRQLEARRCVPMRLEGGASMLSVYKGRMHI